MSQTAVSLFWLFFDTLCPIALGYVLHARGLVTRSQTQKLITFNVRVIFTLLAFLAFWRLPLSAEILWIAPVSLLLTFIPYWVGMAMSRRFADPAERGAFVMSAMLGNTGSLGGLVSFLILGPIGFAYVQMTAVIQNVLLVLFCFPVCQKFRDQASSSRGIVQKRSLRELLLTWNQFSIAGMVAGGIISACGLAQPESLSPVFAAIVHLSCWLNFLPVGLLIDFRAAMPYMRMVSGIIPIKFLLVPGFVWAMCEAIFSDPAITKTMVILAATPTAINAVVSTALYELKKDVAIASFIGTTILFGVAVCPILFWLFA
jgi:predicted permease